MLEIKNECMTFSNKLINELIVDGNVLQIRLYVKSCDLLQSLLLD